MALLWRFAPRCALRAVASQPSIICPAMTRRAASHSVSKELLMRIPAVFARAVCFCCVCLFGIATACVAQTQQGSAVNGQQSATPSPVLRIGGNVMQAMLVHMVTPVYPPIAKQAKVSGTVVLHAVVGADGNVKQLQVISGPAQLTQAAIDAVQQWQYKPYKLNGQAVAVDTTITVVFNLGESQNLSTSEQHTNSPAAAEIAIDPQFKANIMKLLDVTHAMAIGQQAAKTMLAQLRPTLVASLPPTPHREQIVDAYSEKLTALLVGPEVVDRLAGVYARHLSPDDVNAMIQFYATPAGQHALASMPEIVAESQQIGANAAQENIPRIFGELCTEFPELRGKVKFCPAGTQNESSERREGAGKALHARGEALSAELERVSYSHANSVTQQSAPPKAAVNAADPNEEPVNVPEDVIVRKIVHQVNPGFPAKAAAAHVSGTVTMEGSSGKTAKWKV